MAPKPSHYLLPNRELLSLTHSQALHPELITLTNCCPISLWNGAPGVKQSGGGASQLMWRPEALVQESLYCSMDRVNYPSGSTYSYKTFILGELSDLISVG